MSYINTTTPTRIWVGKKEYTEFLISGSCSDDSSLTNSICKTSGSIRLGGVHNSIIMKEFPLPIGSEIIIQCSLPGNKSTRHPRGTLYLINSTINYEEQIVDLEIGCSLTLVSVYENSFTTRIRSLFNFIPEPFDVFDVKDYSFSELSSVLDALGYVMWQDKNGRIQCAKAFGGAGFGTTLSSTKFTSYDDSTAISIQSLSDSSTLIDPSALTITVDWDIPTYEEKDPEVEEREKEGPVDDDTGRAPEEILEDRSDVLTKYIYISNLENCLYTYEGKKTKIEEKKIYSCGKFLNPEYIVHRQGIEDWVSNPDICKLPLTDEEFFDNTEEYYAYEVSGKLLTEERYFSDSVERYQVADYNGPGNQLNYEKTWERMSFWRFAEGAIGQWFDNVSKEYDLAIEEANQKCTEMNDYAKIRDENNYYLKKSTEKACITAKERILMDKTYGFYDCLFASRNTERINLINYAIAVRDIAVKGLNYFIGKTEITNITERSIVFGTGGEILERNQKDYVHAGASKFTQDLIRRAGQVFEKEPPKGAVNDQRSSSNVGKYDFGPPLEVITGEMDGTFVVNGVIYDGWPERFLKSETVDNYYFGNGIVTEKSSKIDYENPENNTVNLKTSTDNSLAAPAEPRNVAAAVQDPSEGLEPCNIPTETRTVTYTIKGTKTEPTVGASWAGDFSPTAEEISMPIGFKPLIPENMEPEGEFTEQFCDILTTNFIFMATTKMRRYESYINKYLAIALAKKMMDNRGIRIVEKMRAEVFNYHPFMPITVVLKSNNKTYMTRTSAATWAFDSTNAVCSFDCYVTTK